MMIADRGYADWIRAFVAEQGAWANIPPKRNRKDPICFSPHLYPDGRQLYECEAIGRELIEAPMAPRFMSSRPSPSPVRRALMTARIRERAWVPSTAVKAASSASVSAVFFFIGAGPRSSTPKGSCRLPRSWSRRVPSWPASQN